MRIFVGTLLLLLVTTASASADTIVNRNWPNNNTALPVNTICQQSSVSICGKLVPTPSGALGNMVQLKVPSPYVHQPFSAQCVAINGVPVYQIIDAGAVTCTLPTCGPTSLSMCGMTIPVTQTSSVGSSINVPVGNPLLPNTVAKPDTMISVECVADGDNAHYQIKQDASFSCNQMPCKDTQINVCNSTITVPGGAMMGTIVHMNMPRPYAPDPFTVQCIGSIGNAPTYQLTDHSEVSCNLLPAGQ